MDKKELEKIIVTAVAITIGLAAVAWREQIIDRQLAEKTIIGGEADEEGCLTAAGYGWCENKKKCLRVWEEECFSKEEIKDYLNEHLSELSPVKEVLGGKFYVYDIEMEKPNMAVIKYEDGHIDLKARVTVGMEKGEMLIGGWEMLDN